MNTLASRLKQLLQGRPATAAMLARACDVSQAAVSDWLSGQTKTLRGVSLVRAAAYFDVYETWIETGKGPVYRTADAAARAGKLALFEANTMAREPAAQSPNAGAEWPFARVPAEQFAALPYTHRLLIEAYATGVADAWAATSRKP